MTARLGIFTACPACGHRHDSTAHLGPDGTSATPKAGDWSLCLRCGQLLVFELDFVGLRLRLPTAPEAAEAATNVVVSFAVDAWRRVFPNRTRSEQVAA